MDDPLEPLKRKLLDACQERYDEALDKHWGYDRPDPGKLVREGLRAGIAAIEAAPLGDDPQAYLESLARAVEAVKQRYRECPISDDGWDDEDGWILGGLSTILGEIQAVSESLGGEGTDSQGR